MKLDAPEAVVEIARKLHQHGFQAWAVGGAVRDALAGRAGGDWDIATDARPQQVRGLFRRTVPIGIEHGTVGVLAPDGVLYEVTTFRRDVSTDGRHAVVEFADSLDDDLARRDFTINAVAWDPLSGELRDPFGGAADLAAGLLRTVGKPHERFAEDRLRVLRALRFAGWFGLRIDDATWTALVVAARELDHLSAERVREEVSKVLAGTPVASMTLDLYARSGSLATWLPELAATIGMQTPAPAEAVGRRRARAAATEPATADERRDEPAAVARNDAFGLALRAADAVSPARLLLRWTALLHTTGYPAARTRDLRGGWRYVGHERAGAARTEQVLRRLRFSNADSERIVRLVAIQSDLFPPDAPDSGIRRWLAHVTRDYINDFFRLRIALWRAYPVERGDRDLRERWQRAREVLRQRPVLTLDGLAVDGRDLLAAGIEPGPRMGELLRTLLTRVIEEPALNTKERLLELVREAVP